MPGQSEQARPGVDGPELGDRDGEALPDRLEEGRQRLLQRRGLVQDQRGAVLDRQPALAPPTFGDLGEDDDPAGRIGGRLGDHQDFDLGPVFAPRPAPVEHLDPSSVAEAEPFSEQADGLRVGHRPVEETVGGPADHLAGGLARDPGERLVDPLHEAPGVDDRHRVPGPAGDHRELPRLRLADPQRRFGAATPLGLAADQAEDQPEDRQVGDDPRLHDRQEPAAARPLDPVPDLQEAVLLGLHRLDPRPDLVHQPQARPILAQRDRRLEAPGLPRLDPPGQQVQLPADDRPELASPPELLGVVDHLPLDLVQAQVDLRDRPRMGLEIAGVEREDEAAGSRLGVLHEREDPLQVAEDYLGMIHQARVPARIHRLPVRDQPQADRNRQDQQEPVSDLPLQRKSQVGSLVMGSRRSGSASCPGHSTRLSIVHPIGKREPRRPRVFDRDFARRRGGLAPLCSPEAWKDSRRSPLGRWTDSDPGKIDEPVPLTEPGFPGDPAIVDRRRECFCFN